MDAAGLEDEREHNTRMALDKVKAEQQDALSRYGQLMTESTCSCDSRSFVLTGLHCSDPASLEGPRILELIQQRAPTIASLNAALDSFRRDREQKLAVAQQCLAAVQDRARLAAARPVTTFVEELVEADVQPLRRSIEQRVLAYIADQATRRVPACSNRYILFWSKSVRVRKSYLNSLCKCLCCSGCVAHQAELAAEMAQAIAEAQCTGIKVRECGKLVLRVLSSFRRAQLDIAYLLLEKVYTGARLRLARKKVRFRCFVRIHL